MVLRLFAALAFLVWTAATVQAEELTQTSLRIPARYGNGEPLMLEGLLVRPNGPGPFPIAVMTHGSPRDPLERPKMGPSRLVPQAREFAKRGWATLVVMRRGYGGSDGPYVETSGPCNSPDYRQSGERGADDLRQAIRYMARQPFADASRIIAVGVSAGGFASVALTADPPPGLVAAISFAGGRGSQADNTVCTPDRLVDAFASFGRTSRLPTLWVYAENDLFFGPALARRFFDAFTRGGGRADFVQAPANGKDGHFLFSAAIPSWTPRVDRFLDANGLSARPIPAARPLAPPPELSERNRAGFRTYAEAPDFKAFAVSPEGGYGWKSGQGNEAEARRGALENCAKHTQKVCRIAFVNDTAIR